jgi:hydrogenase maturation protease
MKKKVLVFGFGHVSQNKNDIAVCVIDYLRNRSNIQNLELLDSNSCEKNLEEYIESTEQLIVIDADHAHVRSDAVHVYEGFEMDAFIKHNKSDNTHDVALREALNTASRRGRLPRHRALVGIQAVSTEQNSRELNISLTISRACQKVFEITENWKI